LYTIALLNKRHGGFSVADDVRVAGERWFSKRSTFREDIEDIWGDWGVNTEYNTLEAVLMRRPGREIEKLTDAKEVRFRELPINVERARAEHDRLVEVYQEHGVDVYYVEEVAEDLPNAMYVRDLVAPCPEGVILCRPGLEVRRPETRWIAKALGDTGVPIIKTISGEGTFEGADLMWVDPETVIIGVGNRSNLEGGQQVERELRSMGVEDVLWLHIPYGQVHCDGIINIIDDQTAICFPWHTPFTVANALLEKGFELLEVTNIREARNFATNFVASDYSDDERGRRGSY
jgi:N-dimethylarginine dimethylaminohydrolase